MLFTRNFIILLVISILIITCEKKQLKGVRVTVSAVGDDSVSVKIFHHPVFEEEVLAQFESDSTNQGVMQFELSRPLMSYITINGTTYKIYLKPGYDLKLSKDTSHSNGSIVFEGEGAPMNNYITHVSSLVNESVESGLMDYDLETFVRKYDSLEAKIKSVRGSYRDSLSISKEDVELIEAISKIQLSSVETEYAYHLHNTALIDQIYAFQKGEEAEKFVMPAQLQGVFKAIPFDTSYLSMEMFEYRSLLFSVLLEEIHNSLFEVKLWNKPNYQISRRSNKLIKERPYSMGIKEYLMANNMRHWMNTDGITPEIDTTFNEFKLEFGNSVYTNSLQKLYDENNAILPGNIAPNFSGRTLEGKLISLNGFKGKVVYVDVWATWCGPCVEEIPYAKKLHSAFQKDEVIFLNVSVDKNAEAWKRMLAKEKDWLGTHIILDQQEVDLLGREYKVNGYPKYFLIDQMGKIVSAKASRPSSEKIKDEIAALLK